VRNQRTASLFGVLAGLALLTIASHVLTACSSGTESLSIGVQYQTHAATPTPTPTASEATAPTPSAAARP
jgi:hypothetical protein